MLNISFYSRNIFQNTENNLTIWYKSYNDNFIPLIFVPILKMARVIMTY